MYRSYDQLGTQPQPNRDVMDVLEIVNNSHKLDVLSKNQIVCVDIYTDWCGPCKQTAPDYASLVARYSQPGRCAMVKYNYDKIPDQEKASMPNAVPVFQFFRNGRQVDEVVGADIPAVDAMMKKLLQLEDRSPSVQDLTQGPTYNKSSIRNVKASMPDQSQMQAPSSSMYSNDGSQQRFAGGPPRPSYNGSESNNSNLFQDTSMGMYRSG